jgi:hypothetical protein
MRRAARVDAVQDAIVDALLDAGCKVQTLACLGCGVADLLVKRPDGTIYVVECKAPDGTLTPAQRKWFAWWGDVLIVRSPEEALVAISDRP